MTKKPAILSFDIESCGVNALKSDLGFVTIFGYKWNYEKRAHAILIGREALRRFDDKALLVEASRLFEQADLLVGHFASVFDRRFIQGRLLINSLPPIPPVKLRDTCMIARSVANFSSNRLKYLAKILDLKNQKLDSQWPDAWFEIMRGNTEALEKLAEYCKGDVLAVEELYERLQPFDQAFPRIIVDRSVCGGCGGAVEYRGYVHTRGNRYRRFRCKSCGKWGQDARAVKESS